MDNRVVGIGIAVVALALYVRGVPQRIWGLIMTGGATKLSDVLPNTALTAGALPAGTNDPTVPSVGNVAGGTSNGTLPGTVATGASPDGSTVAQQIAQHISALATPGVDPALDHLVARLPATSDPRMDGWRGAFRTCYANGGAVAGCAAQATQNIGWSPFG